MHRISGVTAHRDVGSLEPMPKQIDTIEIGKRLRELREWQGMSAEEFVDRIGHGTGRTNWTNVENGLQRPNPDHIVRLCDWLGVTFDYVYRGREPGVDPNTLEALRKFRRNRKARTRQPGR